MIFSGSIQGLFHSVTAGFGLQRNLPLYSLGRKFGTVLSLYSLREKFPPVTVWFRTQRRFPPSECRRAQNEQRMNKEITDTAAQLDLHRHRQGCAALRHCYPLAIGWLSGGDTSIHNSASCVQIVCTQKSKEVTNLL